MRYLPVIWHTRDMCWSRQSPNGPLFYRSAASAAAHRAAGWAVSSADCQIAAIARSRNMTAATRNVRDFKDIGIDIVNPWTAI